MSDKSMKPGLVQVADPESDVSVSMELTVNEMIRRQNLCKQAMKNAMKDGIHYGKPFKDSTKKTLLQPGADVLNHLFMFRPEFEITKQIHDPDFIYYQVRCRLYHIPTGALVGEGFGSCSSREVKYRYRQNSTGLKPSEDYWKKGRTEELLAETLEQNDVPVEGTLTVRKVSGKYVIYQQTLNPDIYDQDNTMLKMACKRGKGAATIQATAASDIFTPEGEFTEEGGPITEERSQFTQPKEKASDKEEESQESSQEEAKSGRQSKKTESAGEVAMKKVRATMWATLRRRGITEDSAKEFYTVALNVQSADDLTLDQINTILQWSEDPCTPEQWLEENAQ